MTTINSELELHDYFHSVHSFIRNRFGLYGKAALQFFNFFFVLKVIEPLNIDFNDGKDENDDNYVNCKFSHLCNINDETEKINQVNAIKRKIYASEHKNTYNNMILFSIILKFVCNFIYLNLYIMTIIIMIICYLYIIYIK